MNGASIIFQSPFYRVFECNLSKTSKYWRRPYSFSPLSIGSLSVTMWFECYRGPFNINFQSPFYRVFECNLTNEKGNLLIEVPVFQSPFYRVFECNCKKRPGESVERPFQSPFYRVFECNLLNSGLLPLFYPKLSVPFLSGL